MDPILVTFDEFVDDLLSSDVDLLKGELDFLPKDVINEFLKDRFNKSLESIGVGSVFAIDKELLAETEWFDDEIIGTKHGDLFVKRSINYSKRTQSITADDLF